MSKYIRTKNKVYEVEEEKEYFYITTTGYLPYKKDVINQADTIKELCDGFYATEDSYYEKDYYIFGKEDFEDFKSFTDEYPNGFARGFIITDKGLIFVAKMNKEKGDLEYYD